MVVCRLNEQTVPYQFGLEADVALRRTPNGALMAEARYFQANAFMVGNVALDDYIEQTIRKRESARCRICVCNFSNDGYALCILQRNAGITPHIQTCQPGWEGTFCDEEIPGMSLLMWPFTNILAVRVIYKYLLLRMSISRKF